MKRTKTRAVGFAFFAEALILLLKAGHTYTEVATYHQKRTSGTSKAFNVQNLAEILITTSRLLWDIYMTRTRGVPIPSDPRTTSI